MVQCLLYLSVKSFNLKYSIFRKEVPRIHLSSGINFFTCPMISLGSINESSTIFSLKFPPSLQSHISLIIFFLVSFLLIGYLLPSISSSSILLLIFAISNSDIQQVQGFSTSRFHSVSFPCFCMQQKAK